MCDAEEQLSPKYGMEKPPRYESKVISPIPKKTKSPNPTAGRDISPLGTRPICMKCQNLRVSWCGRCWQKSSRLDAECREEERKFGKNSLSKCERRRMRKVLARDNILGTGDEDEEGSDAREEQPSPPCLDLASLGVIFNTKKNSRAQKMDTCQQRPLPPILDAGFTGRKVFSEISICCTRTSYTSSL